MRKVLIERPRIGHSRSYHAVRARQNRADELDDLPSCEGMRRPYNWDERKDFSDLLGPLRSYLWSCRGRHWDDVWSEISAQLSNNTVDSHLKHIHVPQFIEIKTILIDGKIYGRDRYFGFREVAGLYVHPLTGLVCGEESTSRKTIKPLMLDGIAYDKGADDVLRPRWNSSISRKIVDFEREAAYIDGFWYWIVFDSVPPPLTEMTPGGVRVLNYQRTDIITKETVKSGRYRADKKQMASRDLRRHGLTNE
jgi:hypothetical protein